MAISVPVYPKWVVDMTTSQFVEQATKWNCPNIAQVIRKLTKTTLADIWSLESNQLWGEAIVGMTEEAFAFDGVNPAECKKFFEGSVASPVA
jgi:hypothetical protein